MLVPVTREGRSLDSQHEQDGGIISQDAWNYTKHNDEDFHSGV